MKHILTVPTFLMILASVAPAQEGDAFAPVTPYVDEQTFLVIDLDMRQLDLEAADNKLVALLQGIRHRESDPEKLEADTKASLVAARAWREQFLKAGGRHVYAVDSIENVLQELPYLFVPHERNADVGVLKALFLSGRADGPQKRSRPWPQVAEPLSESMLFVGVPSQLQRVKAMKPAERPSLKHATAMLPADAGVRAAFIPNEDVRKAVDSLLPPLPKEFGADAGRTLSRGVVFATLATDLSAKTPLTVTVKSEDAAAANALAALARDTVAYLTRTFAKQAAGDAVEPQIKVTEDRVVVTLDVGQTQAFLSRTILPALAAERMRAERVKSASNMRQIHQGILFYVNEHKGAWPETLDDVVKGGHLDAQYLTLPYTGVKGRYVYVKPTVPYDKLPRDAIVLYEEPAIERLLNVGFADGHVEAYIAENFEKLKAEQEQPAQPPQPERPQ